MEYNGIRIEWLGHSSFRLVGKHVIYIDPFQLKGEHQTADLVLITHSHHDHLSLGDIQKIMGPQTWIVGPVDTPSKLGKLGSDVKFHMLKPGEALTHNTIKIMGFPAYNLNKPFHPRANGWLGYLVEIEGVKIFHAGDTDAIPELKALKDIDILLLPVGGTYTMTAEEAAALANTIMPKIAIPMHYGGLVGTVADGDKFKRLARCAVGNI